MQRRWRLRALGAILGRARAIEDTEDHDVGLLDLSYDFGVRPLGLISDPSGRGLHLGEDPGVCGVKLREDFLGEVSGCWRGHWRLFGLGCLLVPKGCGYDEMWIGAEDGDGGCFRKE